MSIPLITLEEHYVSKAVLSEESLKGHYNVFPPSWIDKLADLDAARLTSMDASNVTVQIVSHAPLPETTLPVYQNANDELAAAVKGSNGRLRGFAMLPVHDPDAAAKELERCIKFGFVGALLDNHLSDGTFYDSPRFYPIFERACKLDVPLYLHPTFASEEMMGVYKGNYDQGVADALSAYGWGWHVSTGLHILKLFASGLFDRYPKIKIVIGHMGELLPFQLGRIFPQSARWGTFQRSLKEVWDENIWITTSGMFSLAPLACLLRTTKIERILFSVDYPFSENETGRKFIEEIKQSGLVKEEELEMIAHRNAEILLKL